MDKVEFENIPELNEKKNILGLLADFSINRYKIVYMIIFGIIISGVLGYLAIARESMPEVILPYSNIIVIYPGASPEDVESLVVNKIEKEVSGLEDIDVVRSNSYAGFANIQVRFNFGIDTITKKTEIINALNRVDLPSAVETPEVMFYSSSNTPILGVNLYGDLDQYKLSEIALNIQERLELIDGIKKVEVVGDLDREIHVNINTLELMNHGLSLGQVQESLSQSNFRMPAGASDLDGTYFNLRIDESFTTIEEIRNHIIRNSNRELLLLKDIADISDSYEKITRKSQIYINDESEEKTTISSISLTILRSDGADVIGVCNEVKKVLEEEKGTLYPQKLKVFYWNDRSIDVSSDLNDIIQNALSGLLVVTCVLFLFIGLGESVIVAFVIPLTLLSTIAYMNYRGLSLNGITILGLIVSLGLLVDNAIVVMENIDRLRAKGLDRVTASKAATNQVAPAILASSMTTIAAFVPLLNLSGNAGAFIKVLPQTIIVALVVSFIMSLMVTPMLCSRFLPEIKENKKKSNFLKTGAIVFVVGASYYAFSENGVPSIMAISASLLFGFGMWMRQYKFGNKSFEESKLVSWYEKNIRNIIKSKFKKNMFIGIAMLMVVVSVATIPLGILKVGFFPKDDANAMVVSVEAPYGATLEETTIITENIEKLLYEIPEITSFGSVIGGDNPQIATINIEITDKNIRERHVVDIVDELRVKFRSVSGAFIYVSALSNTPDGGGRAFQLQFKGDDIKKLKMVGKDVVEMLDNTPGIINPSMNLQDGIPQLKVDINKTKAIAMGLNPKQVALEVRGYVNGINAGVFIENEKEYDIVIRSSGEFVNSIDDIEKIHFTASDGTRIPIKAIATLKIEKGMAMIMHDNYDRVVVVGADVDTKTNLSELMGTIIRTYGNEKLPEGIVMEVSGEEADMNESFLNMIQSMVLAMLLVFIILTVQFNSIVQPFIILFTLPMGLVGVISGLILTGNTFGFYAFMGLVALIGIVVNDAIVLVDYTNYLIKNGYNKIDAIIESGKTRFIPVFATSITTAGGILPLAVKNAYYGQLGYGMVFGLMVATVMTLLYIPIFYSLLVKIEEKETEKEEEWVLREKPQEV